MEGAREELGAGLWRTADWLRCGLWDWTEGGEFNGRLPCTGKGTHISSGPQGVTPLGVLTGPLQCRVSSIKRRGRVCFFCPLPTPSPAVQQGFGNRHLCLPGGSPWAWSPACMQGRAGLEESCDASPTQGFWGKPLGTSLQEEGQGLLGGVARSTSLETTAGMPLPQYFEGSRKM